MVFWSITFYTVNAFVKFDFLDMVMSPFSIAILNTVFRVATVMILFPFIKWIEKLVFCLVKDTEEDREEQADFDLLEERFIAYPAIAIGQSHTAINGMAGLNGDWQAHAIDTAKAVSAMKPEFIAFLTLIMIFFVMPNRESLFR